MNESSVNLPLADVFRAANELASVGLIEDWDTGRRARGDLLR